MTSLRTRAAERRHLSDAIAARYPEPDRRTNDQFERAECYGAARYAGAILVAAIVGIMAAAPTLGATRHHL